MKTKFFTMRNVLKALVDELGEREGREVFEWYCQTYNVTVADDIPPTVMREVFGV